MKEHGTQTGTLRKVMHYLKRYWLLMALSILFAGLTVAMTLYIPILVGRAVDLIVGPGAVDFAGIARILKEGCVIILATALLQWLMNMINNKITYQVVRDVRNEAFEKIQELPLRYLDRHPSGEVVSRIIADVDQFADGLLMGFTQLFTGAATILGTLVFMLTINVWITLLVVVLTPLSLFVAKFIATHTYDMFRLQSETRAEQTGLIDEMIGSQKVVQAFAMEERIQEQFDEIDRRLEKCSLKAIFYSSLTNPGTRFVNNLVYPWRPSEG